jgi:hypothetical protein
MNDVGDDELLWDWWTRRFASRRRTAQTGFAACVAAMPSYWPEFRIMSMLNWK